MSKLQAAEALEERAKVLDSDALVAKIELTSFQHPDADDRTHFEEDVYDCLFRLLRLNLTLQSSGVITSDAMAGFCFKT